MDVAATALIAAKPKENLIAFHQRGKAHQNLQNYRRAVSDLSAFLKRGGQPSAGIHNLLGTSLAALGHMHEAIRAYRDTLKLDPTLHQAHVNLGQAYRDLALVDEAEAEFSKAVSLKADFVPSRHRRALLRHAVGDHRGAISDLEIAVRLDPTFSEGRDLLAISHQTLGAFGSALREYDTLLAREPSHHAAHHRAALLLLMKHLDKPRDECPIDEILPPDVKHGACKLLPAESSRHAAEIAIASPAGPSQAAAAIRQIVGGTADLQPKQAGTALDERLHPPCRGQPFAARMQVRLPGFVPNRRLRQAGLAVLDVAQRVPFLHPTATKGVTSPSFTTFTSSHDYSYLSVARNVRRGSAVAAARRAKRLCVLDRWAAGATLWKASALRQPRPTRDCALLSSLERAFERLRAYARSNGSSPRRM